jgi:hypothetical protein
MQIAELMKTVDLESLSDRELMTFLYTENQRLQHVQQNLQLLNAEWEKRVKEPQDKPATRHHMKHNK